MQRDADGECERNAASSAVDSSPVGRVPAADASRAHAIPAAAAVAPLRRVSKKCDRAYHIISA